MKCINQVKKFLPDYTSITFGVGAKLKCIELKTPNKNNTLTICFRILEKDKQFNNFLNKIKKSINDEDLTYNTTVEYDVISHWPGSEINGKFLIKNLTYTFSGKVVSIWLGYDYKKETDVCKIALYAENISITT